MIKKLFVISLLNFALVLGVVFMAKAAITPTIAVPNTTPTQKPTVIVSVTPTITPTVDPLAGHCLVYVDGTRYDLTEFRDIHSGGNIFQCGTDMSDIFHGQHPSSFLAKISQYKI